MLALSLAMLSAASNVVGLGQKPAHRRFNIKVVLPVLLGLVVIPGTQLLVDT